jgi:hypothetical protein
VSLHKEAKQMSGNNFVFQDGATHAQHPSLDVTLCGMALEGDELPVWDTVKDRSNEFGEAQPATSSVIDCKHCLDIIRVVKAIPAKCLSKAHA